MELVPTPQLIASKLYEVQYESARSADVHEIS